MLVIYCMHKYVSLFNLKHCLLAEGLPYINEISFSHCIFTASEISSSKLSKAFYHSCINESLIPWSLSYGGHVYFGIGNIH